MGRMSSLAAGILLLGALVACGLGADTPRANASPDGRILTVDGEHGVRILAIGGEDGVQPGFRYISDVRAGRIEGVDGEPANGER